MDPQTEKEPAPHKKTPPGWLWWSLLGAGLYALDQASKLWIIRRFPLNYLNEKLHKYAYLPDFPGFQHINADGTLDFATNGRMPEAELARLPDLNPNTVDALNKLRELEPISFLDGTMNITRVHNTGVAFGLGNGTVWSSYLSWQFPCSPSWSWSCFTGKLLPHGMAQAGLCPAAGGRSRQPDGPPDSGLPDSV